MKRTRGGVIRNEGGVAVEPKREAREREPVRSSGGFSRALAGVAIAALLIPAGTRTGAADTGSVPPPPAPSVELDRLLKLPDSFAADRSERRGGATRLEWLQRFEEARAAIDEAQTRLKRAEQELDELADDSASWNVAPPGATDPQSGPLSFRLREEIRRQREAKERAEKALRALEVKADLAGVPADWRKPEGS